MTRKTDETTQRALRRLVDALVQPEPANVRIERLEEALSYAALALGRLDMDRATLYAAFDVLGAELLVDKMERDGAVVVALDLCEADEEQGAIIATSSPVLARHLNAALEAHVEPTMGVQ